MLESASDFRGIQETARATWSLAVNPSFPAKDMKEFVEYVRANPGKVNFASPGLGTPHHLVMEQLKLNQKLNMIHIPYAGQAEAVTDVISGQVPVMAFPTHVALPLAEAGKLRMLGVFSDKRVDLKPDMATSTEQGFPVTIDVWYGFLGQKAMSDELVAKFNTALNEIVAMPSIKEALGKQGLRVVGGAPKDLDTVISKQVDEMIKLVEEAKIPKR